MTNPAENDIMSITHCQIDRSSDTCTPHEHKSLDDFISKVEASGEDKKHKPLGWVDYGDLIAMSNTPWDVCHVTFLEEPDENTAPIYGQSQLDTAVAEAVAKERNKIEAAIYCLRRIMNFSDSDMRDGDAARDIAKELVFFLSKDTP